MGLVLTFLVGVFILIGTLIVYKTKDNDRIINFSISLAFGVMISLIILEIVPEAYEMFIDKFKLLKTIILIIASAMIGIGILKVLDRFIPDHHEHGKSKKHKEENLHHIALVSAVALSMHNIIEGFALYTVAVTNLKMGIMMCIGIGLHNIPMGMIVTSTFIKGNKDKNKIIVLLSVITLSTFIGGLFSHFLYGYISNNVIGVLLGITLGMLLYIIIFELLPKVRKTKYKKDTIIAIISGSLILIISSLL